MTRIAIIGNAGGGKSTVARRLRDLLELPLHSIDLMQWRPGWRAIPKEEFSKAHAALLVEPRWIIDGWGDFDAIENRFSQADTIVLVDYPLWRHYWWAIKRQFMCLFRSRIDGPPGCPMLPMTWPLLKMLWAIDKHAMPMLRALVDSQRDHKEVFHIRTLSELLAFHREAERHAKSRNAEGSVEP
jgi:adenylate kinase family enzyme